MRSSHQAGSPANLTSGGTSSPPWSRIRDGRAPRRRRHSWRHSLRRRICTRPDNDDAPLDPYTRSLCSSGLVSDADQDAGFMTAPSGVTPCVANRHKAISNLRANVTTITFRMQRPVRLMRSRNHLTWAGTGWYRWQSQANLSSWFAGGHCQPCRYPVYALPTPPLLYGVAVSPA
jgi:hypothetical protein